MSFLYHVSISSHLSVREEVRPWNTVSKDFGKIKQFPQSCVSNSNSQESVRNLFDSRDRKNFNTISHSLATRVNSQSTTISSVTWSKNDIPTSSKFIGMY